MYDVWKTEVPRGVLRRPCLPIEPDTERLMDLNKVDLLKLATTEIIFENKEDVDKLWRVTKSVWIKDKT
ncbi:hypothetical protein LB505_008656 [Fusarium chuoi]|nr:hypothetical protein LB505_008656 [Fusarium chuoi]